MSAIFLQELAARAEAAAATAAMTEAELTARRLKVSAAADAASQGSIASAADALLTISHDIHRLLRRAVPRATIVAASDYTAAAANGEMVQMRIRTAAAEAAMERAEKAAQNAERRAARAVAEGKVLRRVSRQFLVQLSRARADQLVMARAATAATTAAETNGVDPASERLAEIERLLDSARSSRSRVAAAARKMTTAALAVESAAGGQSDDCLEDEVETEEARERRTLYLADLAALRDATPGPGPSPKPTPNS